MKVLILCTGNSCRSIMAEGMINKFLEGVEAKSAGSNPSGKVNENAKKILKELNAWDDKYYSKSIDEIDEDFDLAITVCDNAKEACPTYPRAKKTIHMPFNDPDGKGYEEFVALAKEMQDKLLTKILLLK